MGQTRENLWKITRRRGLEASMSMTDLRTPALGVHTTILRVSLLN